MNELNLVAIAPANLSTSALQSIGRIVRAAADLEDTIDLWICKLTNLSETKALTMLGRSNISTKIGVAKGLAQANGETSLTAHKAVFDVNIEKLLQCRNAVAHGTLIGQSDHGYVFRTSVNLGYEDGSLIHRADVYSDETLRKIAQAAEARLAHFDDVLELRSLREKRRLTHLEEIRRGQPKSKKQPRRKPPPPPSPA